MPIIFGSPEAAAILQRDKELAKTAEIDNDWYEDTTSEIDDLRDQIEALEVEIAQLEDQIIARQESPCPLTNQSYRDIRKAKESQRHA